MSTQFLGAEVLDAIASCSGVVWFWVLAGPSVLEVECPISGRRGSAGSGRRRRSFWAGRAVQNVTDRLVGTHPPGCGRALLFDAADHGNGIATTKNSMGAPSRDVTGSAPGK